MIFYNNERNAKGCISYFFGCFLLDLLFFTFLSLVIGLVPRFYNVSDNPLTKPVSIVFIGLVVLICLTFPIIRIIKRINEKEFGISRIFEVILRFIISIFLAIVLILLSGESMLEMDIDKVSLYNSFYFSLSTQLLSTALLSSKDGVIQYLIHLIENVVLGGPISFGLSMLFSNLIFSSFSESVNAVILRSLTNGASWAIAFVIARFLINCTCLLKKDSKDESVENGGIKNE